MRDILKKTTAVALVAAAALAVGACKSETTNVSENVTATDLNATGSMSDASATDNSMMGDNAADNSSMMGDNTANAE